MSVRLSPAASLLRNSKLFALPPAVALPPDAPSSDQVTVSDTATSIYPTHAAIETPSISLSRGDWGFKRSLPLKSTTKTANPIVRLVRGIDTQEHVTDFESAADHALNLRKFQDLNQPIRFTDNARAGTINKKDFSVFRKTHDNTTNLSSSSPAQTEYTGVWPSIRPEDIKAQLPERIRVKQLEIEDVKKTQPNTEEAVSASTTLENNSSQPRAPLRWRYAGPALSQMSGMQFDAFLKSLGSEQRALLRDRAKQDLVRDRAAQARDEGTAGEIATSPGSVTEDELSDYMRRLRADPKKFGPMLAVLLDLPEGQPPPAHRPGNTDPWEYGRETLAAPDWRERGPPRTHPSAGLSYLHTTTVSTNHPYFGPQKNKSAVLARAVKQRFRAGDATANFGVAGFIIPKPMTVGVTANAEGSEPQPGGLKVPVIPQTASIDEKGALMLNVTRTSEYYNKDNEARHQKEDQVERQALGISEPPQEIQEIPSTPQLSPETRVRPNRRAQAAQAAQRRTQIKMREKIEPSQDVDNVLAEVMEISRARSEPPKDK